jgi:hypothetical protein
VLVVGTHKWGQKRYQKSLFRPVALKWGSQGWTREGRETEEKRKSREEGRKEENKEEVRER